jgi:hypothetical protein
MTGTPKYECDYTSRAGACSFEQNIDKHPSLQFVSKVPNLSPHQNLLSEMRFSVRLLSNDVLRFPENSNVFRFGAAMNPTLRNVNLAIANGQGWAVMGSNKGVLLEVSSHSVRHS